MPLPGKRPDAAGTGRVGSNHMRRKGTARQRGQNHPAAPVTGHGAHSVVTARSRRAGPTFIRPCHQPIMIPGATAGSTPFRTRMNEPGGRPYIPVTRGQAAAAQLSALLAADHVGVQAGARLVPALLRRL